MRFGLLTYGLERPAFGIARSVLSLGRALQQTAGAEPLFLTTYRRGPFVEPETPHAYVPGARLLPALMSIGALQLHRLATRLQLPLVHDPSGVCPFVVGRRTARYGRVVTLHDATSFRYPATHSLLDNILQLWYVPATLRNVDAIITPTADSKRDLVRFLRLEPQRVHVVPGAVEAMFRPAPPAVVEAVLRQLGLCQPYVLYVGALEPRKNLPTLVRAFGQVRREQPGLQLVVVGGRRWKSSRLLPRDLEAVRLTGYVPDELLPALYTGAAAFCFPSLAEGFGLPVLEAMACGTPVITSTTSSLPEVAGEAALLVDPLDEHALAGAVRRVLTDADLAHDLRERGRQRAAIFSWTRSAEMTLAVYQAVLRSS